MRSAFAASALATLLGPPGGQRVRASQSLLALLVYAVFAIIQHGEVLLGLIDAGTSTGLSTVYLGGALLFFLAIRSGINQRVTADPSLTLPQAGFGLLVSAASYAITGPARGAVMTLLVLILVFTMFSLRPAQSRAMALFAFALLAPVMLWKSRTDPLGYPPAVELIHAGFMVIVLVSISVLAGRMGTMRRRLKSQKLELERALQHIGQLATRDELTGLVNRRHMATLLDVERARQRSDATAMTLVLLDIDLFKRINDSHGHQAGDSVLKAFAEASRQVLRSADVLARWGGEEFLLMLPDTTQAQAQRTVERLRQQLAAVSFDSIAAGMKITFSAGVSLCGHDEALNACIERADRAMYRAKTQGRDCTVMA